MSKSLEVSPLSDTKMDISETTASQESLGISPDEPNLAKSINEIPENLQLNSRGANTETAKKTNSFTTSTTSSTKNPVQLLDNQDNNLDNESTVAIDLDEENTTNTSLRSALTLVNNHPLMSPPPSNTETDSRHQPIFNYPDLVPEIDKPLRLGNSQQNELLFDMDNSNNTRRKISVLRESSPDFLSSGSEPDLSQFQATVAPSFETVALVSNIGYKTSTISSSKPALRRKIPVSADLLSDDISSIDTISNQSFDDDLDPNLASLSPSSSVLDEHGFSEKEDDAITPTGKTVVEPLPVYTAAEERRDSRNWQKITLPDGKTREIDMKVIDPYKRVLSHGGYLKAGGNNAIVIFSACHLPDRSRTDYHYVMDNLFLYVVKTLEQLVTEDYVLVYLHGGSDRGNVPPFPWLKKCYQLIDRRLRKSLKNLYLVHPTFWLKSIVWMSRPFISSKFWKKMVYVKSLEELYTLVKVERASIPDKVKNYETKFT